MNHEGEMATFDSPSIILLILIDKNFHLRTYDVRVYEKKYCISSFYTRAEKKQRYYIA